MTDRPAAIEPITFEALVATGLFSELDEDIRRRYPGPPDGVDGFEFVATHGYAVVAWSAGEPIGCGAFRPVSRTTVEIKRMYVRPAYRGRGIARRMLVALEDEARARGYAEAILETGTRQPEAIALYRCCGYREIAPYEPYVANPYSVCFAKAL